MLSSDEVYPCLACDSRKDKLRTLTYKLNESLEVSPRLLHRFLSQRRSSLRSPRPEYDSVFFSPKNLARSQTTRDDAMFSSIERALGLVC